MSKRKSNTKTLLPILLLFCFLPGCSKDIKNTAGTEPVSQSRLLIGTVCRITLYDGISDEAFESAFARIGQIEEKMSVNLPDSELSRVNRAAGSGPAVPVSADTFTVLGKALDIAGESGGIFDPSIGPLVELWGIGTENARIPEPGEIEAKKALTDYQSVELKVEDRSVRLLKEGMKLDLGGIAKGYAADAVRTVLADHGVRSAIINLGGNVLVLGKKPGGRSWKIGIQDPSSDRGTSVLILELEDMSVVTSGAYERFFTGPDGRRYHHILDTKTGYPADSDVTSVTVVTRQSLLADALSTTVFALGRGRGMELIESYEGVEGIFITADKKIYLTSGLTDQSIPNHLADRSYSIVQ